MSELAVAGAFRTRAEAEMAGGLLEEADIPFVLQSQEGMFLGPLPQGATLLVRPDHLDRAREVLRQFRAEGET